MASRTGREAWTSEEALGAAALELLLPFLDERENPRHRRLRLIGVRAEKLARVEGLEEIAHEPPLVEAPRRGLEPAAEAGEFGEERHAPILRGRKSPEAVSSHPGRFWC